MRWQSCERRIVIDFRESFWTVPGAALSQLWVRVLWRDFAKDEREFPADAECVNLADLVERPAESAFGHRGLVLHPRESCTSSPEPPAQSPLLLDLDLEKDSRENLDDLLYRVRDELDRLGWEYRIYNSGVGYHAEVNPASIEGGTWCLFSDTAESYRQQIRAAVKGQCHPCGSKACIDVGHPMMRMVGSKHRAGGIKVPLVAS